MALSCSEKVLIAVTVTTGIVGLATSLIVLSQQVVAAKALKATLAPTYSTGYSTTARTTPVQVSQYHLPQVQQ